MKRVDSDARAVNFKDLDWVRTYSADAWDDLPNSEIQEAMDRGHVLIIRGTDKNKHWKWDINSAGKIRSTTTPVEVQCRSTRQRLTATSADQRLAAFQNRNLGTGVQNIHVPLASLVDDRYRDPGKVYNMLNAPQSVPLVQIPRVE